MVDSKHSLLIQELQYLFTAAVDLCGLWPLPPAVFVPALSQPDVLILSPVEAMISLCVNKEKASV